MSYYGARKVTPIKHLDEIIFQEIEATDLDGATVGSATILKVEPDGELLVTIEETVGNVVTLRLTGGVAHHTYTYIVRIPLSNGERRAAVLTTEVK
jgi:hypothetical protein